MKAFEYLKSLIKADTLDSSKSFALVLSCIVGALMGLCVCFCLIYDVCSNGYIRTDLDSLGVFMLCIGCFIAGGGINKALADRKKIAQATKSKSRIRSLLTDSEIEVIARSGFCIVPPILVVYILLVVYIIVLSAKPAIYQFSVSLSA